MTPEEIDAWLLGSLEDRRLSRSERQCLGAMGDHGLIARRAFEIARADMADTTLLDWLEGVLKVVREDKESEKSRSVAEAYFSPGDECLRAITRLFRRSSKAVDICVFTITDDRLAEVILETHRRGVAMRIITDNSKAEDLGSDIDRFEQQGIDVRVDRSPHHMHHKFAIFDDATLLTGSYNWTRGAAADNQENLIVTDEPRLVGPFRSTFDRLWASLA